MMIKIVSRMPPTNSLRPSSLADDTPIKHAQKSATSASYLGSTWGANHNDEVQLSEPGIWKYTYMHLTLSYSSSPRIITAKSADIWSSEMVDFYFKPLSIGSLSEYYCMGHATGFTCAPYWPVRLFDGRLEWIVIIKMCNKKLSIKFDAEQKSVNTNHFHFPRFFILYKMKDIELPRAQSCRGLSLRCNGLA